MWHHQRLRQSGAVTEHNFLTNAQEQPYGRNSSIAAPSTHPFISCTASVQPSNSSTVMSHHRPFRVLACAIALAPAARSAAATPTFCTFCTGNHAGLVKSDKKHTTPAFKKHTTPAFNAGYNDCSQVRLARCVFSAESGSKFVHSKLPLHAGAILTTEPVHLAQFPEVLLQGIFSAELQQHHKTTKKPSP